MKFLAQILTLEVVLVFTLTHQILTMELNPVVHLNDGILMGETGKTDLGREMYKFWCIPYGRAERFEPSVPAEPWEGVRDASECSQRCPSASVEGLGSMQFKMPETEDCLILNVFTNSEVEKPKPVMVWYHGGYFVLGSSLDYSGEMFLDHDVVLVTVNYRLGALGFLTSGDGVLESNLGMKDMVLALQWVQENIQDFGGDPNRVTIFGESAGGAAIGLLVLSPMTKGLFHQAIAHSGSSMIPCAYQGRPKETFANFAAALNCTRDTSELIVACLKEKTVEEISNRVSDTKWFIKLLHPVFPAIENGENIPTKSEIFLPDNPRKMLKDGNFNHVPLIIGIVEDEGAVFAGLGVTDSDVIYDLNYGWIPTAGIAIGVDDKNIPDTQAYHRGLRRLRKFYFGYHDISTADAQAMVDVISDGWFIASLDTTVRYHSVYAPVYPYMFVKKGALAFGSMMLGDLLNRTIVSHGEELQYLFWKGVASAPSDKIFKENFKKLWVSFARDGKPTETWGSAPEWPPAEKNTWDYKYYILDDDTSLLVNPFKARVQIRNDLDENEWNDWEDKNNTV